MSSESRVCQNCKQNFTIEPDDFVFYEKINVPPPTFCPECRFQRRLAFLNFFNLFQRKCDLCEKMTVSMYSPDKINKVYCPSCYWSDNWNPLDYGRDYDFERPFFNQFKELWNEVPLLGLSLDIPTSKSSPWNNHAGRLNNCYMLFHADMCENSAYGYFHESTKDVFDTTAVISSELLFDSMHSYKCSRCAGSRNQVANCIDCLFVRYAFNCQYCFASTNIRNKKYYIFNRAYSKDEYFSEIKKWDLGSYKTYKEIQNLAEEHWKKFPPKPMQDEMSVNCSGSHVFQSKNCNQCFEVTAAEDGKYLWMIHGNTKDSYDISSWGNNMSLCYDSSNIGKNVSGLKFCQETGINVINAEYCKLCDGHDIFGSVSVRKGEFVILNKRYEKEAFEKLREKIIQHMNEMPYKDKKGNIYKYGEFFPAEISPFAYNETIASNFFPMTKDEIAENGYKYKEPESRKYETTIKAEDLPDHIKDAPDSILNEVIKCAKCERGYRIIPMELKFLRERNFPLPRECPFCRIESKFSQWVKNLRLMPRVCDKCGANFETEFTKEEAPIIYCKKCWQEEYV